MAQVTMTGVEYAELLTKERKLEELMDHLKADRKFSVPESSVHSYSTGEFERSSKFPMWAEYELLKDMEHQLVEMSEVEFARLVKADMTYYKPMDKEFRQDIYRNEGYTNMCEFSKLVKTRWDSIKRRLDAGELVDEEEEARDGE